jgi:DNA segregation ATPase FtsK/SpoIIIE, S-DNA-T family
VPPATAKRSRSAASRSKTTPAKAPAPTHQRRELVAIVLMAVGALLAAQIYFGFGVGPLGNWTEEVLRLFVGRFVLILPPLLVALGMILIFDQNALRPRALRLGSIVLAVSMCLALAAGLFGLGGATHTAWFRPHLMQMRGGAIGETVWYGTAHTVGAVGTGIIVVAGMIAGLLLISGASLGRTLRRSGSGAKTASRHAARGVASAGSVAYRGSQQVSRQMRTAVEYSYLDPGPSLDRDPLAPPPLQHPLIDGADYYPDVFAIPNDLPPSPALADHEGHVIDTAEPAPPEPAAAARPRPTYTPPPPVRRPVIEEIDYGREDDGFDDAPAGAAPAVDADDEDTIVPPATPASRAAARNARPTYRVPSRRMLHRTGGPAKVPHALISETSHKLEEALSHFGVTAKVTAAVSGPRVTRYELQLAPGTKVGRITALRDDLAYALAARDELRILAPIPGKQAVGVEVPNPEAALITLGDIYREFPPDSGPLMAWLGLDISGKSVHIDLAKMPHLLIAGSTGTGKSVCLNVLLASLLLRSSPNELRMILIDPKKVELNHYESIPQLLTPVVTNMRDASAVLANVVREMENRYELMGLARARNLRDWNAARALAGEPPMPYMLVVIDELADLMMVAPAEVEDAIIRLAQKSRAVGIHLLLATQRPSADVITGMIKANVPSRIAFAVSSQVDSRVILDAGGAESLLGSGDMLFRPVGTSRLQRVQGAYVSEDEILALTNHWRAQGKPQLRTELMERPPEATQAEPDPEGDEMLTRAIETVVQQGTASVSLLQRRLGVGYARAGRLVDQMERLGVVSGHEGSKPRTVLVGEADLPRILSRHSNADHHVDGDAEERDAQLVLDD